MNEKVKQLLKILPFQQEGQGVSSSFEEDGYKVSYYMTDREVNVNIKKIRNPFFDYIQNLDDDIFVDACEEFVEASKMTMQEFENKIKANKADKEIALFKQCVKKVVLFKIGKLNKYINDKK